MGWDPAVARERRLRLDNTESKRATVALIPRSGSTHGLTDVEMRVEPSGAEPNRSINARSMNEARASHRLCPVAPECCARSRIIVIAIVR